MVFTDFKITNDGIYNYDTGVILSQDKFMTQKGTWSKRLLKSLSLMDNVDLNKVNNVFSKVYGGKTEFAKVLYEIIPNFKTQKTNILVNNKFYKSSYKKVLLENVQEDKNKFVSINKPVGEKLSQFKRDILLDIKKLDKGLTTKIDIDMTKITMNEVLTLLKRTVLNKKFVVSFGGKWITLNDKSISNLVNKSANYLNAGEGSDAEFIMSAVNTTLTVKIVEYGEFYSNSTNEKVINGGEFFDYHHTVDDLNLERYGIFHKNNIGVNYADYLKENCLYQALKECGLTNDKLEEMKTFVNNRNVPISSLKALCEKLKIRISLKRLKGVQKSTGNDVIKTDKYGKEGEIYKIGLLNNHYFIDDDKTNITSFTPNLPAGLAKLLIQMKLKIGKILFLHELTEHTIEITILTDILSRLHLLKC